MVISSCLADFIEPLRNHHFYAKASLYVFIVLIGYTHYSGSLVSVLINLFLAFFPSMAT